MDNIQRFETIADYNAFSNNETLHPLVSVVDLSRAGPRHQEVAKMMNGYWINFAESGRD